MFENDLAKLRARRQALDPTHTTAGRFDASRQALRTERARIESGRTIREQKNLDTLARSPIQAAARAAVRRFWLASEAGSNDLVADALLDCAELGTAAALERKSLVG